MSETNPEYRVKNKNRKMNNNTRNDFASYGLEILKRSVLLVLYEQYVSGPSHRRFLTIKEIGEQLDILPIERDTDRPRGKYAHMNGLTHGILAHLSDDDLVKWLGGGGAGVSQRTV